MKVAMPAATVHPNGGLFYLFPIESELGRMGEEIIVRDQCLAQFADGNGLHFGTLLPDRLHIEKEVDDFYRGFRGGFECVEETRIVLGGEAVEKAAEIRGARVDIADHMRKPRDLDCRRDPAFVRLKLAVELPHVSELRDRMTLGDRIRILDHYPMDSRLRQTRGWTYR